MNKKIIRLILPILVIYFSDVSCLMGQCFNTVKYPAIDNSAPPYSEQIDTISTANFAGHYCVVKDLIPGRSYTFSSKAGDYVTHRIVGGLFSTPTLGGGNSPYTFTAMGHNGEFHINLISPPCVTDMINRTTTIVCNDCPAEPAKVIVGQVSQKSTLEVNGEIKVADTGRPPQAGMVRWNSNTNDFEGYDGSQWRSFTKSPSSWGNEPVSPMAIEDKKLLASDGAGGDDFGYSVSMSEDYVVIGAPFDDILYPNQGAAYVFVRSGTGWTQQAKLTAFDGGANDQFGYSVSISGDYAVIGAYGDDTPFTNQGSAYVFVRSGTTWAQQIKLIASDGADNDRFGNSVSISGDYVVVGSNGDDSNKGSAYVFVRSASTWSQQAKLTASDGGAGDYFGNSVSISGDYVVIGAYLDDLGLNINQGSVYVFARSFNTWPFQVKLTDSAGAASDNFGSSVSISGDYVIIGAPGDDESFADQGSAYIFMRSGNTWSQQTKLTASDGVGYDHFGNSVSISGDYAVIGAINDDNQGSAYVFVQSGTAWTLQTKLTASDGTTGDNFGYSVSISGDNVVIGVYLDDISSFIDQGSAYVFRKK